MIKYYRNNKSIAFNKCKKVIESCTTFMQLNATERYVGLFSKMYQDPDLNAYLNQKIHDKVFIIARY